MSHKSERNEVKSSYRFNFSERNHQQEEQKWKNSLISLHQVLNNLENENLKRYNSGLTHSQTQSQTQTNFRTLKFIENKKQNYQTQTGFKFTIQPEPWFNDNQTNKLKRQRNITHVSKSFHLTLPKHLQTQRIVNRHNRSSSTIDPTQMNTIRDIDQQRLKKLKQTLSEKDKLMTQNFNYTNQQKAKVSIIHLAHQKQHKKIEKILKYKAHFIDKTGLKHEKINQHSKYLVEALKNLSFDDLIPNKKKNSLKIQGNKRLNTLTSFGKSQTKEMKSASCGKLQTLNQTVQKLNYIPDQVKYSIKRLEPQIIKIDQPNQDRNNHKITFKPKRKWIFDRKYTSEKSLILNGQINNRKYMEKIGEISNHFLKINKLKKQS